MTWLTGLQSAYDGFSTAMDNDYVSSIVNGALYGAIGAGAGGGDILEGAAWGAAGGAIAGTGDDGIFGQWANEIGGAVGGYGIDKALGGDGLIGAGAGGLMAHMAEGDSTGTNAKTGNKPSSKDMEVDSGKVGLLEKYGLQNGEGDGTLLGKTVVGAAMGYAQSEEAKETREDMAKLLDKRDRNKKDLDEEFKQRDLKAFTSGQGRMITRNG